MIDIDPNIAELLDQHTPPLQEEGDWNHVLRDAGVLQPHKRRPVGGWRRRAALLVVAVAVVTAASLTGISLLGGSPSTLERARAAVTIGPSQVLHERVLFVPISGPAVGSAEMWVQGAAPYQYRLVSEPAAHGRGAPAHYEQGGLLDRNSLRTDTYQPRTNTIQRLLGFGESGFLPLDPATAIRNALSTKNAHVLGKRQVNGRTLIAIQLTSLASNDVGWGVETGGDGKATVLLDPSTDTPVQIQFDNLSSVTPLLGTPHFGGSFSLIERFTTFQRLPATTANLSLTSLTAQHPAARCVIVGSSDACKG
jgi:hypothetical protein